MPVGSTRLVQRILGESGATIEAIGVASNPEFLREGTSVRDFLHPNRVVIGCDDPEVAVRVSDLYKSLDAPILVTEPASAEMIKYASNAFLATKISFVNAIANLCEAVDADVREVAMGMGYDNRIGFEFLHPGPGYGGSCFPKDTAALLHTARPRGLRLQPAPGCRRGESGATRAGDREDHPPRRWIARGRDDRRMGPHVQGQHRRRARLAGGVHRPAPPRGGAIVRCYDPSAGERAALAVAGAELMPDPYEAVAGAQVVAVLTEWDEFRWLDFERVRDAMASPAVLDARNLLDPSALRRLGFTYEGIGRS